MHQRRGTSLVDWPVGHPAVFIETVAGPALGRRLAQLGVRPGATLTPLQRTPGRGLVVAVAEMRVALDRQSVAAIRVDGAVTARSTSRDTS
ncbi:MAG: FeoA family protein [Dermatophilaceae bacterium]